MEIYSSVPSILPLFRCITHVHHVTNVILHIDARTTFIALMFVTIDSTTILVNISVKASINLFLDAVVTNQSRCSTCTLVNDQDPVLIRRNSSNWRPVFVLLWKTVYRNEYAVARNNACRESSRIPLTSKLFGPSLRSFRDCSTWLLYSCSDLGWT